MAVPTFAFRFLAQGTKGVVNGTAWPRPEDGQPGSWVESGADGTARGVFAERWQDLPYHVHDELWCVELGGVVTELSNGLLASRLRLRERVVAWDADLFEEFALACLGRLQLDAEMVLSSGAAVEGSSLSRADLDWVARRANDLLGTVLPEPAALILAYLLDAIGAHSRGSFSSVGHIVRVAASDRRIAWPREHDESAAQVQWLRQRLPGYEYIA